MKRTWIVKLEGPHEVVPQKLPNLSLDRGSRLIQVNGRYRVFHHRYLPYGTGLEA